MIPDAMRRDVGVRLDAWLPPTEPCVRITAQPQVERTPIHDVDVILVADNSMSMGEEAAQVAEGINTFVATLGASELDYRLVVVSEVRGWAGICVPPPLGSADGLCGVGATGRFLPIDARVESTDGPAVFLRHYPEIRDFLRPDAVKVFLWITDDDAAMSSDGFRSALASLEPEGMFGLTLHHAIVGVHGDTFETWAQPSAGACPTYARLGRFYLRLAQCRTDTNLEIPDCTWGTVARVCETDWSRTFDAIAARTERVLITDPVTCTVPLPAAPPERVLDVSRVVVTYRSADATTVLPPRTSRASCEGWRFDDDGRPTAIVLCDSACRRVQADPEARLEISVACYGDPG